MIHWRLASSDDDAKAIAPLILIDMYREVGRGKLNPDKAFYAIYACINDGKAAMIFDDDTLIGSLGLVEMDFWYSDELQLVEQWAYIHPPYRDGKAMRCMFEAAQEIAVKSGSDQVNMIIFNKERAKARSPIAHIGEQFSFRPAGAVISIEAAE